jgi:hypothetical protein
MMACGDEHRLNAGIDVLDRRVAAAQAFILLNNLCGGPVGRIGSNLSNSSMQNAQMVSSAASKSRMITITARRDFSAYSIKTMTLGLEEGNKFSPAYR